jgi:hypothetical protein
VNKAHKDYLDHKVKKVIRETTVRKGQWVHKAHKAILAHKVLSGQTVQMVRKDSLATLAHKALKVTQARQVHLSHMPQAQ